MASREIVLTFDTFSRAMMDVLSSRPVRQRPTWQFGPDAPEHPVPCRWPFESCRGHVTSYPQPVSFPVDNPVDKPVDNRLPVDNPVDNSEPRLTCPHGYLPWHRCGERS